MKIAGEVNSNPKGFWRYVNSKIKVKVSIPTMADERLATTDENKAEILNKLFSRESLDDIPDFQDQGFSTVFDYHEKICNLNCGKVTGLPPRVLKEAANDLSFALSVIFKKSLSEGKLPVDWKVATVIPQPDYSYSIGYFILILIQQKSSFDHLSTYKTRQVRQLSKII